MVNTPYDDVFRTLLTDCTALIIPVVNELFHTSYTGKETIHLLQNEHFIKLPDGNEQERITDSSFEILGRERKRYHVECQSTEDGSMIVRMFEYDTQLALENREVTAGALVVHFPDSAIVALRHTKNMPEVMTVMIRTPGGEVSYAVPVLKVRQYTVEEIFEKKLYFLIPFHIFVYEKSFKELEENSEKLAKLEEEYTAIVNRLEEDRKNGDLNEYEKVTILEMSDTVIKHLAAKYEKVRKGVGESMGGKVLEYEAKDILNRGRAEGYLEGEACGRREGRDEGRAEGEITGMKKAKIQLAAKLLQAGNSVAYVADLTELPEETVQKLSQAVEREDE